MRYVTANDRTSMNELDVHECLVLLRWETVGRLAVSVPHEGPVVVPVNITMLDDMVVFRCGDGRLFDLVHEAPVSVQVDRVDWYRRIGWSVLVRGLAHEVDAASLEDVALEPWAPGIKEHWFQVVPDTVTGRRLELNQGPLDGRGYL